MGTRLRFIVFLAVMIPSIAFGWTTEVEFLGKFRAFSPRFLAVDEAGNIYSTQYFGPIKVFDPSGTEVREITGKTPEGKRFMKMPVDIAFHGGLMYVTDESLCAVVVMTLEGEHITTYGRCGKGPKQFREPHGIAIANDIIYVADTGNRRIQMLGSNGVYIGEFGNSGDENSRLRKPTDIAFLSNGDIAVADNEGRNVTIYDYRRQLKIRHKRVGYPFSLQAVSDGYLVSDNILMRIMRFDNKGNLVYNFGSRGSGPGQFPGMNGISLARNGTLYIADPDGGSVYRYMLNDTSVPGPVTSPPPTSVQWVRDINARVGRILWDQRKGVMYAINEKDRVIHKFRDGEIIQTIAVKGWKPSGLALSSDGSLWVSDLSSDKILKMRPDGNVALQVGTPGSGLGRLDDPADIVINTKDVIFIADRGNERIQMFNTDGVFMNVLGKGGTSTFFRRPDALAMDDDGILYVLDSKRREVLVFSADGLPLSEIGRDGFGKHYLDEPVDITVTGDEIFVLDAGLEQVLVFNIQGILLGSFGAPGHGKGDFDDPSSVEAVGIGQFYVSDTGNGRVQELSILYTPDFPSEVIVKTGKHEVLISWEQVPGEYVEKYIVYRSSNETGPFEKIGETTTLFYKDEAPVQPQYYRISALAVGGNESHMSQIALPAPEDESFLPPLEGEDRTIDVEKY